MDNLEDIVVPIVAMITTFGSIFGIAYIYFSTRHKERMLLIEKGADAKLFQTEPKPWIVLKYSLLFIGVGIGIILGNILTATTSLDIQAAYFSMIFIFGGAGLGLYYLIFSKIEKKRQNSKVS